MPTSDIGATYTSGRRPKAAKERNPRGMGAENAAHSAYGDLAVAEGVERGSAVCFEAAVRRLAGSHSSG